MEMEETKFCKDCKFFKEKEDVGVMEALFFKTESYEICTHPKSNKSSRYLVTGIANSSCDIERLDPGGCSRMATYFEPKKINNANSKNRYVN